MKAPDLPDVLLVGLISDTHGRLRPEVFDRFREVDHIVHAGDIGPPGLLDELEALGPVTAVWGNTDGFDIRSRLPETARVTLRGRLVVAVHGHQFGSPSAPALFDAFPDADVIVFGHTHKPAYSRRGRRLAVNPGAAGPPRFGLRPSVALLRLGPGAEELQKLDL